MTNQFQQQLLNEAIRIANDLLNKAKNDKDGVYWETLASFEEDGQYKTKWSVADSIYNGSSGIILFLMEVYKKTNDRKYYDVVKNAAAWLVKHAETTPTDYYAFFTGRMGVGYTLLKCSKFLNDNAYLKSSLDIIRNCGKFLKSERPVDDMINGYAGALLGLLHMHAETKEEWLLKEINDFADVLIKRATIGVEGLYWDRSHQQVRGLCGFSHGAAGIGAAFLELGNYFNNNAFFAIAEQAFMYETHYFNAERGNWPDFRKGFYNEKDFKEAEEAYRNNDLDYFTSSSDMNAWCHGAAGVGLSRLRAYDIFKNDIYKSQAEQAILKTYITDVEFDFPSRTFTLCHGGGGNADLFIEAHLQFGDQKFMNYAKKVAEKILENSANGKKYQAGLSHATEEDMSLFMGNAGIGYFLLRLTDCENIHSIEYPRINKKYEGNVATIKNYPALNYSLSDVNKILVQKNYYRTLIAVNACAPDKADTFFKETTNFNKHLFPEFVNTIINTLDSLRQEKLLGIFKLEETKMIADEEIKSAALLYAKQYILSKEIEVLLKKGKEELLRIEFSLDKDMIVYNSKYDFSGINEKMNSLDEIKEDESCMLLLPTYAGISEWKVSPLVEAIVNTVKDKVINVEKIFLEVADLFDDPKDAQEAALIRESIFNQCIELIKYGIIQQHKA